MRFASAISRRWLFGTAAFLLVSALFAVPFARHVVLNPGEDFQDHVAYASRIHGWHDIVSPHFGFEFATIAVAAVGHVSYTTAGVIVVSACYGLLALLLLAEMRFRDISLSPGAALALVLAILVSCQVFLFTIDQHNYYFGYFSPLVYHSPSQQMLKVTALAAWFLYVRVFLQRKDAPTLRAQAGLTLMLAASAIMKPSFLIAFVPVSAVRALQDLLKRRWRDTARFAVLIAVPALLLLVWQSHFAFGAGSKSGVAFQPFYIFPNPPSVLFKGILSLLFPIAVTFALWPQARASRPLTFAWLLLAFGVAYSLLLVETGPRLRAGNFAWSAQIAVFVLYVESALLAVESWRAGEARPLLFVPAAAHVVCGIIMYRAACLYTQMEWW